MALLKEDVSLDIEWIDSFPLEEHMKLVGTFTHEQFKEYVSAIPFTESKSCPRAVRVNYSLEDELARGSVLAEDFMNKMRKKYLGE